MRFERREMPDGSVHVTVEFSVHDMTAVRLYRSDWAMLRKPAETVADALLDCELIARRSGDS